MVHYLLDIAVIFVACLMAEAVWAWFERLRDRCLDIGCDYCEEAKRTYRTPDKRYWLCRACMEVYLEENDFTEAQMWAARKQYRKRRAADGNSK